MRIYTKKHLGIFIILSGSLLVNAFFAIVTIAHWNYIRPLVVKFAKPYFRPMKKQNLEDLENIGEYIDSQAFSSESDKIDFIRNWINKNSISSIDEQHEEYAFNTPRVLSMLWNTNKTANGHAHLSCGPRALAMSTILDKLKIQNRLVMIFTDDNPQVNSHTFLEAFNKETERWELQDPDFNVCYINNNTQERVSTCRLIFGDLGSIIPMSIDKQGWKNNNIEHLKEHFFEALMYMNHLNGERSVILINTDRFNASKIFKNNGNKTFYQFSNKYYGNSVFVENQGFDGN